ncbi:hypothetical protein BE17_48550 [Sorangium cellulosum]|uniref:DUF4336 domain-containing protein n=1 Tax=Sorangium cellulosum TaxID=56 RepID=A0A150SGK2_SORCE|nr:hypothetical protein BE17_48550 [Sorangium cellulosum]
MLRQLDQALWAAEDTLKLPGVRFPVRSPIVRLGDGGLVLFSPLPGVEQAADEIRALGEVRAIVAPNLMHHLGLAPAARLFPGARVYGPRGLEKKRPDVAITGALDGAPDPLWSAEIDQVAVGGMPRLDEVAFFHRPSKTLFLWDLCFHITQSEHLPTRLFMRLNGAYGRFGPSRIARSMMRDRAAVGAAVKQMIAWGPERVVVAHGDVIERGGQAALQGAFERML